MAFRRDLRSTLQDGPAAVLQGLVPSGEVDSLDLKSGDDNPGAKIVAEGAQPSSECYEQPDVHSSSSEYAKRFSGATGLWMLERQEKSVHQALSGLDVKTILELGGGHAQIAPGLVSKGYTVTVRGSTPECSHLLAALLEKRALSFSVGNLLKTDFPDKSFDVVICLRQISHFTHWEQLVQEATRLARQLVIIDYPPTVGFNVLYGPLYPLKKLFEGNSTRTYRCFSAREVELSFGAQGFEAHKSLPQFFLPMVLHRRIKNRGLSSLLEKCFALLGLTSVLGSPIIASFKRK